MTRIRKLGRASQPLNYQNGGAFRTFNLGKLLMLVDWTGRAASGALVRIWPGKPLVVCPVVGLHGFARSFSCLAPDGPLPGAPPPLY